MIRPRLVAHQVTVAEDQEEYKPVTAALVDNPAYRVHGVRYNTTIVCYEPSPEEREILALGAPIYLHFLTMGGPLQPHIVSVGHKETAAMYRVEVER